MKNTRFPVPIIIGVVALAASCGGDAGNTPSPTAGSPAAASPSSTPQPATPTPTPEASACQPNPDPGTPDIAVVDKPLPNASSSSPLAVSGQFAAFEAQFRITLYDAAGNAIADKAGHTAEGQVLSPFSESVPFTVNGPTPACLWVYESSARDGSPIHVVQVPVTLTP